MTAEVDTTNRELVLAAQLMARPELVRAVFPADGRAHSVADYIRTSDLRLFQNEVPQYAIAILATQGESAASPAAMWAALADLPQTFAEEDIDAMIGLIPDEDEVTLDGVFELKNTVITAANERQFLARVERALKSNQPASEVAAGLEAAIEAYRRQNVGRDSTATGIFERLNQGVSTVRWRCGCDYLDRQAPGIGPDGKYYEDAGILAQGEVVVIAAQYGTGKSRLALNWVANLLDQGASVSMLVLEDGEAQYSLKLMGIRFGIQPWRISRYIANQLPLITDEQKEEARRIQEAIDWYRALGSRLRIYDGQAKTNIFNFRSAKALMEEDAKLYGATHTVVDYIQAWPGDTETHDANAQSLREYAARNNVGLILISQVSNETMKFGAVAGQVPTRGGGTYGAIAHWGYLLTADPVVGQKELCIAQQKGRDAGRNIVYAHVDVETGCITEYYGVPKFGDVPQLGGGKNNTPRRKGGPR